MSNNISSLRSLEAQLLSKHGGVLTADDVSQLKKAAAKGGAEDKAEVQRMMLHDAFDKPETKKAALGGAVKDATPIAGQKIGNTTAVRSFGLPQGYTNKFQAISVARSLGTDPLAIVKDAKGMWHAVQTKEKLNTVDINKAFPLSKPDLKSYGELATKLKGVNPLTSAEAGQLAMYGLGVPEELLNVTNQGKESFDKEKLNIDLNETTANGKAHVHDSDCGCGKNGAALEISPGRLKDGPEYINATLAHEAQHVADDDLLVSAIALYNKRTPGKGDNGKPYDPKDNTGSQTSMDNFKGWVKDQKGFTDAQKATLKGMAGHVETLVEGSAYLNSFMTMIGSNREAAADQLLGFADYERQSITRGLAKGEDPKKMVTSPEGGGKKREAQDAYRIEWKVRAELMQQLKANYASLPADKQDDFKKAVALVETKYPNGAKLWSELFPGEDIAKWKTNEIKTGDQKANRDIQW